MINKLWEYIQKWWKLTALPWLMKSLLELLNLMILFIVYSNTDDSTYLNAGVGLWIFVLLGYYIFWKFLGIEKIVLEKNTTK